MGGPGVPRWPVVAAVLLAGAIAAACGSAPTTSQSPTAPLAYGKGALGGVSCREAGRSPSLCAGLLPAPAGVTDHLVLDTHSVQAGTPVHGTLVVDNATGAAIDLRDPHGCRPGLAVVPANATTWYPTGFSADCQLVPLVLSVGTTSIPVTVSTTYPSCVPSRADVRGRAPATLCTPGGGLPPLPPGSYHAVLEGLSLALPQASAPLTITRG